MSAATLNLSPETQERVRKAKIEWTEYTARLKVEANERAVQLESERWDMLVKAGII